MKSLLQTTLDENITKDVISTRTQAGQELSYLETWYVIDRLNQVLGQGNWAYQIGTLIKVYEGEVEQYSGKAFSASYTATVYLNCNIDGKPTVFSDVGYGQGSDKKNPGNAHEMATKGAVSDALKRAAKNLGRSMGLALYDKTQEYVGDNNVGKKETKNVTIQEKHQTISGTVGNIKDGEEVSTKTQTTLSTKKTFHNGNDGIERPIKKLIEETVGFLVAQKKISVDAFKTNYLGGKGLSTTAPSEYPIIYEKLKKDFFTTNGKGA